MKLHINRDLCDGYSVCEGIRPDVFQVGGDGIVHLLTEHFTETDRPGLEDAAVQCPAQALRLQG